MSTRAAELVIARNEFYAQSYKQIKRVVTLLLFISALLIGFVIYQNQSIRFSPKYFPTTPDGKLIISPPFSENHLLLSKVKMSATGIIEGMPPPTRNFDELEPYGDNALVLYWAWMAVEDMFDYDYIHYRRVIENARQYFTSAGHEHFIDALVESKNLETVKARSAVVVPRVSGEIKLVRTYTYYDRFAWDLEVPVQLTYESVIEADPIVQNLLAKISIVRVSTTTTPFYGLAIYKLNFEQIFDQVTS